MLYLTYIMNSSVDLARYGVSHVKELRSGDCDTITASNIINPIALRKAKIVYNFGLSECNRVKAA